MKKKNKYKKVQIYEIPPNTEFWSIALQLNVKTDKTLYVRPDGWCAMSGKPIFGKLQLKFSNIMLSFAVGKDMSSYIDAHNGDISVDFDKCKLIKEYKNEKEYKK
jgi:hypothetical protein